MKKEGTELNSAGPQVREEPIVERGGIVRGGTIYEAPAGPQVSGLRELVAKWRRWGVSREELGESFWAKTFFDRANELEEALESQSQAPTFTVREQEVITDLAKRQEISEHKVLVQGLRLYQLIVMGSHRLEEVEPGLGKLAPAARPEGDLGK